MRAFRCESCHEQLVFFENSACLHCGAELGYLRELRRIVALGETGEPGWFYVLGDDAPRRVARCVNHRSTGCNWLVDQPGRWCSSCLLTRERPYVDDRAIAALAAAESAKRRLVFQLDELALPTTSKVIDPTKGLAFDFCLEDSGHVITGHDDGLITIDLAESDDGYREAVRRELGEPYRTVLGHLRHEIGHYYEFLLIDEEVDRARAREVFGDERVDYAMALERHYQHGPQPGWSDSFVSAYATMHPYEDFAETFAHYLHILDTLQTAAAAGIRVEGPIDARTGTQDTRLAAVPDEQPERHATFKEILAEWLPLTYALNAVNRSMGRDDLYPFVLAPPVIDKLAFIHELLIGLT